MIKYAHTMEEVVLDLENIIEDCIKHRSHLGIFAALYRKVTLNVKKAINEGRFEDNDRMEIFDVKFANRYLEAYHRNRLGEKPTSSWGITFASVKNRNLVLMQHLLMGMNAHISLDLGIAASEICPGDQLPSLRNDFVEINRLLIDMVDDVQDRIGRVSPTVRVMDWMMLRVDEAIVKQGLILARDAAWEVAEQLAPLPLEHRKVMIADLDSKVTNWSKNIKRPNILLSPFVHIARQTESRRVPQLIQALYDE